MSNASENSSVPSPAPTALSDARPEETQVSVRGRRFRWQIGAAIILLGVIAECAVWSFLSPDRTRQVFFSMPTLSATAFLLLLWWVFLSGVRWRLRLLGLVAAAGIGGLCALTIRVEGFEGDMFPRFGWRWRQSSEERAENYWEKWRHSQTQTAVRVPGDSIEITDSDWPGFRGPLRDGIVRSERVRHNWDEQPLKLLWRHPVGLGWSSFAVVSSWAFTQEQRGDDECVVCYDIDTGEQLWEHCDTLRFSETLGGDGPRATPTVFDSRVYALGATGILNCLDAGTGQEIWQCNILDDADAKLMTWGMAGSPLLYHNLVIVSPGGKNGQQVVAYDRLTGNRIWAGGNRHSGYSAPHVVTIGGMPQILVFGGDGLSGFDPSNGHETWFVEWPNGEKINVIQPIPFHDEAILIGSGYGKGSGLFDVVRKPDRWTLSPIPRWTTTELKLKFNDAVLRDGFVYGLDEGILVCLDLQSGQRRWKRGRYGYGQLLLIGETLLIQAENGDIVLVEATPERHHEITRFHALEGKTWNHPLVCRGHLLVRNGEEAACYSLK